MVGLGEEQEVLQVMDDLRATDTDFSPSGNIYSPPRHAAIDRYVTPEEFAEYEKLAMAKGFLKVSATPLTAPLITRMRISGFKKARQAQMSPPTN